MINDPDAPRDVVRLVVPQAGRLLATGDAGEPYRLLDDDGQAVAAVAAYFAELQASGCRPTTLRSYGNDLLRWWRFLASVEVAWDKATRTEARDFMRWMQLAAKPVRPHWRHQGSAETVPPRQPRHGASAGTANAVTGKATPGRKFKSSTAAHAETVLRSFYDFQLEAGAGPIVNPFPLARARRSGRAHAHHSPMDPFRPERTGRYRPKAQRRAPKRIPDDRFNELFASLKYHRDRALLAFWVSTGARAAELLGTRQRDADPGDQLIAVTRKGTGAVQPLPASPDAFVWLRLYQEEVWRSGAPRGARCPLWWTLRRPWRPLTYHAARAMFVRVNALLGSNWTLHDLRHTAAYRLARDPQMPLTDVQWILGHRLLSTTQLYVPPGEDEMISNVVAFHERQARPAPVVPPPPASGYDPAALDVLFGSRS
ncbi:site-specific integrase [Saccharopolyspora sp. K220]|uniref:tyrosine-type recombinase/integrase n=1 Tax=Saccharopolyspora soli TaxID=2926618 RepID=UPI001F5A4586|nr:site-specific integrase [Saccharopolyspora soli]MCI2422489.1 site-specific integrase [Saccharopolyspora soli]